MDFLGLSQVEIKQKLTVQGYIRKNFKNITPIPIDLIDLIYLFYLQKLIWNKKEIIQTNPIEFLEDNKVECHGRTTLFADYIIKSNEHDIFSWNIILEQFCHYSQYGFVSVTDDNKPNISSSRSKYSQLHSNGGFVSVYSNMGTLDAIIQELPPPRYIINATKIAKKYVKIGGTIKQFKKGGHKVIIGFKANMKEKKLIAFYQGKEIGATFINLPDKIIPAVYLENSNTRTQPKFICSIEHANL